jgi:putative peptide zinc metalloprotease protein
MPTPGSAGGGQVAVNPRDERGVTAVEKWFQIDLELSDDIQRVNLGGRVYVRFDLGTESLARQWYREVRRVFLSRFDV